MELTMEIIKAPFTWGLLVGLLITFFVWKSGWTTGRHAKREIKRLELEMKELQGHLNTQLKIHASGNDVIQSELERLREQNENLRINNATLQHKPGRVEMRQLQVQEIAIRSMREQAPGFAQAWEKSLREAEVEMDAAESGFKKLMRRVVPGLGTSAISVKSLPVDSEESKES